MLVFCSAFCLRVQNDFKILCMFQYNLLQIYLFQNLVKTLKMVYLWSQGIHKQNDINLDNELGSKIVNTREFLTKTPRPMNNQHKIYRVQVTSHLMNNSCWNEFFLGLVLEWRTKHYYPRTSSLRKSPYPISSYNDYRPQISGIQAQWPSKSKGGW